MLLEIGQKLEEADVHRFNHFMNISFNVATTLVKERFPKMDMGRGILIEDVKFPSDWKFGLLVVIDITPSHYIGICNNEGIFNIQHIEIHCSYVS